MKLNKSIIVFAAVLALVAATAGAAPRISPLRIVPGDSVAVGMVKLSELRTSPLSGRIFAETDKMTTDGDSAKFLADAGFDPSKDVDTVTIAMRPGTGSDGDPVVVAEGRFDADRIIKAAVERGATPVQTKTGTYYLLEDKHDHANKAAFAFVDKGYAVLGTEDAVKNALNAVARGGSGFPDSTLGKQMKRIDPSASAWMLVDVARMHQATGDRERGPSEKSDQLFAAVQKMSYATLWVEDTGEALRIGGTALSDDEETRGLVEDTIRGALSAARLAAQEKDPELVNILRKASVKRDGEGVSFEAMIPGKALERWKEQAKTGGPVTAVK